MKLVSWNVNGIRAASRGEDFKSLFQGRVADIICLQEVKATPDQLDFWQLNPEGFRSYWHCAQKAGYSGVAIYTREEPLNIKEGLGIREFDDEGRVIVAEFKDFHLINAYFPNSQRDAARLPFKLSFCKAMKNYCDDLVMNGKSIVLCGDLNIAHQAIDLKNPKANEKNAGYLPEERAWMSAFLTGSPTSNSTSDPKGEQRPRAYTGACTGAYIDTFRHFQPGPGHYSWWSYRPGVREKNIGWRLDYHVVNEGLGDRLVSAQILPHLRGSDHCPVTLELRD